MIRELNSVKSCFLHTFSKGVLPHLKVIKNKITLILTVGDKLETIPMKPTNADMAFNQYEVVREEAWQNPPVP